jgi:predicted small integral membrane protein
VGSLTGVWLLLLGSSFIRLAWVSSEQQSLSQLVVVADVVDDVVAAAAVSMYAVCVSAHYVGVVSVETRRGSQILWD